MISQFVWKFYWSSSNGTGFLYKSTYDFPCRYLPSLLHLHSFIYHGRYLILMVLHKVVDKVRIETLWYKLLINGFFKQNFLLSLYRIQ